DMGLGKTLQALALLVARAGGGPQLVVAPTSVCWNWRVEAERFAPSLRVVRWGGAARMGEPFRAGDLVIASYALVARDAERLAHTRFATLILDEAQVVKNAHTQRARAVHQLGA